MSDVHVEVVDSDGPEDVVDQTGCDAQVGIVGHARWFKAHVGELAHICLKRNAVLESKADGNRKRIHYLSQRGPLFRDRLDRVFACDRYSLGAGSEPAAGLDILYAELTERDVATLPIIDPELVYRSDIDGSPGWTSAALRFLLASCRFGQIDQILWSQKSPTKQRVAKQSNPGPRKGLMFPEPTGNEISGLNNMLPPRERMQRSDERTSRALPERRLDGDLEVSRARDTSTWTKGGEVHMGTSKSDASKAGRLLANPKTPKAVKSVAGSDLAQTKSVKKGKK